MDAAQLDNTCINTIRFLSADAVQKANSGHPGLPMGAAALSYVLWTKLLRHNPTNPAWPDRDRFILSAGHGSMLLYSLLHLTGYDLSLDEIKQFRQWNSRTPGHPESHLLPGVEATTGPLGQGMANAVGFAIAEAHLAARFNRPGHEIVNHYTWTLAGDGDLMEGVSAEASSLAGHLGLGKLIAIYDSNRISLAGTTSLIFTEDVAGRYAAYGWQVLHVNDGNDLAAVEQALVAARQERGRPSLVIARTHIGYGAPHKQDTFHAHGAPLGPEELRAAKENLGWQTEPSFLIPPEAHAHFRRAVARGQAAEREWTERFEAYRHAYPTEAAEFERVMAGKLPDGWDHGLPSFPADAKGLATRKASEAILQALAAGLPELIGGSADLNPSTYTWLKGRGDFQDPTTSQDGVQGAVGGGWGHEGRNLYFGVREHAMGAAVNGLAHHGGLIPYGATFLTFSDYMRPAVRLSALARLGAIWVYTHDSIGLGEDGPTHQPVEHYAALRAIPDLLFIRPCDANETVWAWRVAIANRHRPTALALSRQNVPTLDRSRYASAEGLTRGAYVLNPALDRPDLILLATGSEVALVVAAAEVLAKDGIRARIVSMPCWELFEEQPEPYRVAVLPPAVPRRLAVEAGVSLGWHKWIGGSGATHTLDRFGASAPGEQLFAQLGFTVERVAARAREQLR
jgi:transketolase